MHGLKKCDCDLRFLLNNCILNLYCTMMMKFANWICLEFQHKRKTCSSRYLPRLLSRKLQSVTDVDYRNYFPTSRLYDSAHVTIKPHRNSESEYVSQSDITVAERIECSQKNSATHQWISTLQLLTIRELLNYATMGGVECAANSE